MKPFFLRTALLVFCSLYSLLVCAQNTHSLPAKEIILETPGVDLQKSLPGIKNTLKSIDGISFEGFCNSKKILMLIATDNALHQFMQVLKEQQIVYYFKKETTIAKAKEACGNDREIESSFSVE